MLVDSTRRGAVRFAVASDVVVVAAGLTTTSARMTARLTRADGYAGEEGLGTVAARVTSPS